MESKSRFSHPLSFRLRSISVVMAFLGLLSMITLQTVRLERSAKREALLRAELQAERDRAEASSQKARAAMDQLYVQIAQEWTSRDTPRSSELQRELLERTLRFYEGTESKPSSPEDATRLHERLRQIRSVLGEKAKRRNS
jgi:hypothetical protein